MRMIPATPYNTHSQAERKVFDCLRSMREEPGAPPLTAFHSLNLTRHARKRFGEIDFLVFGQQGLFVLEVKGGRVACADGRWTITDRNDREQKGIESPFRQAESALHGLMTRLRSEFTKDFLDQFVIGYGVIFPDCDWPRMGAEWDAALLADARGFRGFDDWLRQLFSYWRAKSFTAASHSSPSAEAVEAVKKFLRPDFEAVIPLSIQTGYIAEKAARLTEDQLAWIDVAEANPRTFCTGGAGAGKTFLAAELARRWTADGANVLLACASPWISGWLDARLNIPNLVVSTIDGIEAAAHRAGCKQFDALIVDEAQDLMQSSGLNTLDAHLLHGLDGGKWCFFGDLQNQSGLIAVAEAEAQKRIEACAPVRVPLRTNCRNTLVILENIRLRLGADMGVRGTGYGPPVKESMALTREEAIAFLARELEEFVGGGISHSEITILSPFTYRESLAAALPEQWRRVICPIDRYGVRNFPPDAISFARIADFKGLENEAIIIVDLPGLDEKENLALHYVGMSRARAVLSVIKVQGALG